LSAPPDSGSFTAGANVVIQADATDDNSVARVEFYADGNLIGTSFVAPYSATINNISAGNYSLTAKAFDNAGLSTISTAVNISVREAPTARAMQRSGWS